MAGWGAVARAAVKAATDKRTWKIVGAILIIAVVILFFILSSCVALCGSFSSMGENVINAVFGISYLQGDLDEGMKQMVRAQRESIADLITDGTEHCSGIDTIRLQSAYFVLIESEVLTKEDDFNQRFVECFTREDTNADGSTTIVPIKDDDIIFENISKAFGVEISKDTKTSYNELCKYLQKYLGTGQDSGESGSIAYLLRNDTTPYVGGNFISPFKNYNWRNEVTSVYGTREHPISHVQKFHAGVDLGVPLGTSIYAVNSGTVLYVRYSDTGYGYHFVINHGGKITTTYAHCSQIFVVAGDEIKQGQLIAKVGSTGNSTGPHLHLEVRVNGVTRNPSDWLP